MNTKNLPPVAQGHAIQKASWVQTDRATHEAWALLTMAKPRAGILLHHLVARVGNSNAVVVSQKTLAKLMKCSLRTIQYAISDLAEGNWIQVVRLNGPGTVAAYVVNDRVAWGKSRDQLHTSTFSATVIADYEDQDLVSLSNAALRQIPALFSGERQLPTGPGEDPPSQPSIPGLEPDLPVLSADVEDRKELELRGQMRIDGETGELLPP